MAKEIEEKKLKKEKKDKKEKKEKRAETDGVTKSKKDKKEKKSKGDVDMVDALEAELEKEPEVSMVNVVDGAEGSDELLGAIVPFAQPLCDNDKEVKKILKTVKKCTLRARSHLQQRTKLIPSLQPQRPRRSVAV
jgi:H/ACA ribonucleoprotein complex subunit 2